MGGEKEAVKVLEALQPQLSEEVSKWRLSFAAYFLIVLVSVLLQLFSVLGLAAWSYVSCKRRMRARCFAPITYPISVVVPCYLPNEAAIIKDTIWHILTNLTHIEQLNVHVVYNTPHDMDLEKELAAMAAGPMPEGRCLSVERVHGSRSKAANLNHILPKIQTKCVAIYDADHHPEPKSLAMAVDFLMRHNLDCCQGSTFIRQGGCVLRTLINGEFFVTFFIALPILEKISGTAFFGGANGVWRTSSVKQTYFDADMMTEDIDCFARTYTMPGFKFGFLPECRSGELAPSNWQALWKQRMRWAVGWEQVTIRYSRDIARAKIPRRRKLAFYYIFLMRYVSQICGVTVTVYNTWSALDNLTQPEKYSNSEPIAIQLFQRLMQYFFLLVGAFAVMQVWLQEPKLSTLLSVIIYYLLLPVVIVVNTVVIIFSLVKIASGNVGSWVVTNRSSDSLPSSSRGSRKWEWCNVGLALAVPILLQGLIIGSVFAYGFCQKQVGEMQMSWTPFGLLSPATVTALDGKVAVQGFSGKYDLI